MGNWVKWQLDRNVFSIFPHEGQSGSTPPPLSVAANANANVSLMTFDELIQKQDKFSETNLVFHCMKKELIGDV